MNSEGRLWGDFFLNGFWVEQFFEPDLFKHKVRLTAFVDNSYMLVVHSSQTRIASP